MMDFAGIVIPVVCVRACVCVRAGNQVTDVAGLSDEVFKKPSCIRLKFLQLSWSQSALISCCGASTDC